MSTRESYKAKVGKVAAFAVAGMFALGANASSVTVDSVTQRWPWNNKVDITYTVTGGQNVSAGVFCRLVFTASIGTTNITIDGVHDVGANASDGTHTVTWTPPADLRVKALDCTMTATLLSADNPSGDDYVVIDLNAASPATAISYEGLLASQEDSNARYNTATYKTDKMVLRKVPRWIDKDELPNASALSSLSGYPTGDSNDNDVKNMNARKYWQTDRNYYMGVFLVTQDQYTKVYGTNPSLNIQTITGNEQGHRPVDNISWNTLRVSTPGNQHIPTVDSNSGSFLQRLNYRTGNKFGFDLPTEVMFEIAARAGTTTKYFWGDTALDGLDYVVCKESSTNNGACSEPVGSRLSNPWGLYDMSGHVWEMTLDDSTVAQLANTSNGPFEAAWSSGSSRHYRGGEHYNASLASRFHFKSSARQSGVGFGTASRDMGFRISMIAD